MEHTDEKLVADYLAGDEGALAILISRYLKPIFGFVYRYTGSAPNAQDLTQEVFVKAWRHIKSFKREKKFKTWLFSIAKNTAIDFLRTKKEVVFSELDAPDGENTFADTIVDSSPLPPELIEREDIKQALAGAMEKISPSYRPVLYLRYNDHFTFREIAEILEEPLDTIKSRHRRALAMLKKFFGEH